MADWVAFKTCLPLLARARLFLLCLFLLAMGGVAALQANPMIESETWDALRADVIGDAVIEPENAVFEIDIVSRAENAAVVPLHILHKSIGDGMFGGAMSSPAEQIESVKIIIDENPSPVAAEFSFGEAMHPLDLSTNIRVNEYSNVRVISKIDGKLLMDGRFVKASGGCSAPAVTDPEKESKVLGNMTLEGAAPALFANIGSNDALPASKLRRSARLVIQHPNYSGLSRDQITHLFVPAHFINHIKVYQDDELLFTMDGGISISENPVFEFGYRDNGAATIRVVATDTEGNEFSQSFDKSALDRLSEAQISQN